MSWCRDAHPDAKPRAQPGEGLPQYNWDAGWNIISEEDYAGTLTTTYINAGMMILGDVSGNRGQSPILLTCSLVDVIIRAWHE